MLRWARMFTANQIIPSPRPNLPYEAYSRVDNEDFVQNHRTVHTYVPMKKINQVSNYFNSMFWNPTIE